MNILIVAPYASLPTDKLVNRFSSLAKKFSQRGHKTTFVTSSFSHYDKDHRDLSSQKAFNNLDIILIDEPGYRSHVGLKRLISIRTFRRNFQRKFRQLDDFDVVYSAYPTIGHNLYLAHAINRKMTSFVVDVQDVWPESFSSVVPAVRKIPTHWLPFSRSANKVYSSASALIAVSQT